MKRAIVNATLWTVSQGVIENGVLLIEQGKIAAIGSNEDLKVPEGFEIIDAKGHIVTPGFIDAHSHVGLAEEGVGWAGDDLNEATDPNTAQVRPVDGINPMDLGFADCLDGGVTTAQIAPGDSNVLAGIMQVIKTTGTIADSMVIKHLSGVKAVLGESAKSTYGSQRKMPGTRMGSAAVLRAALSDAAIYLEKKEKASSPDKMPAIDLRKESLCAVLKREVPLSVHAVRADDIATAIRIAKEFKLDLIIENCSDGHLLAEEIANAKARVCLGPTIAAKSKVEFKNLGYETHLALESVGVSFTMVSGHPNLPASYLNLNVALAIREGLSEQVALESVTINAARFLGLEDRIGSLEIGKDADIVIWDDEPFELTTSTIMTIIDGEIVKGGKA